MNKFLKEKFALTDSGVKMIKKASLASFLTNVGYMAFMMIAMYFADNTLKGINHSSLHYGLIILVVTAIVFVIVDWEYVSTYNATYEESKNIRLEISETLKNLPLSYFSRHDLSDLAQSIMQDVSDIEHAMSHAIPRIIGYAGFLALVALGLLFSNLYLGLAVIIPLLIGFLMMYISKDLQKRWTTKYFWKARDNSEAFQEAIEMQRDIKSYDMVEETFERVSKKLEDSEKLRLKTEFIQAAPMLTSISFMKISLGTVSLISSMLLKADLIDLIYVIGYVLAAIRLVDAVGAIEESFAEALYIDARVKRINEIRNTETQKGKDLDLKNFDIELENVGFAYKDDVRVIDDVSFTAKSGEVTAIVGPSGCGKSTLLRLISRLYDYDQGQIIIDGNDIKDISTDSLFEKISFVFQDVVLFNASVLDNIRMGRTDASDEEVIEAARMANCQSFVDKLPEGYDTFIGENGSKLSGGERQRISIARAFLKKAPIILLDEISSSLDIENEREIQKSLNKLVEGKTVIIVSHRLKSVEGVDKIVVLDMGKIDAIGRHEELLKKSELYKNLVEKSGLTEEFVY